MIKQTIPPQIAQKEPCEQCRHLADPVSRDTDHSGKKLARPTLRGWFCANCGHLTPAIWRERGLEVPQ